MKRVLLARFILFFLLLSAAGGMTADLYEFKLGFRPGQIRRYNLDQALLLRFQIPGQKPIEVKSIVKAVFRQEVLRTDSEGTELACYLESWQRQNWVNGEAVAADPKEKERLLALRARLKVSPQGETRLIEPTKATAGWSPESYLDYSFLPSRPVAVGEEWSKNFNLNLEIVTCPTTIRNRLEKIQTVDNKRLAQIAQELQQEITEFSLPLNDNDLTGEATAGGRIMGAGRILFDLEEGAVREEAYLAQGRLTARITTGDAKLEMPMDLELTVLVSLLS